MLGYLGNAVIEAGYDLPVSKLLIVIQRRDSDEPFAQGAIFNFPMHIQTFTGAIDVQIAVRFDGGIDLDDSS